MDSPSAVAKARIARTNDALAAARRVLILGAGAVGVELAGEITSAFPDLHVIMVESADDICAPATTRVNCVKPSVPSYLIAA